jgi:prephenate dehydrogenase
MTSIAIMGAGGKMGYRLSRNLKGHGHDMRYVEVSPAGQERMKELGISASPQEAALKGAEVVILAVPDTLIGKISHAIAPGRSAGAI